MPSCDLSNFEMIRVGSEIDDGEFVLAIDFTGRVRCGEIVLDEDGGIAAARAVAALFPSMAIYRADKTCMHFEIDDDPILMPKPVSQGQGEVLRQDHRLDRAGSAIPSCRTRCVCSLP